MGGLQKVFAIIGGLAIAIGVIYLVNTLVPLGQDMMIILGVVLTLSAGTSLYFMTKGSGG
ncbi:hypothetical protein H0O02_02130 [Candidatus Micrarchaeota archaeon]|nr:hypothetical protein [Candidatus Micrarchaeota archaeon]